MNVWQAAAELVRQTRAGALATVARARGSTPVPAGTKMLVGPEGRLLGSVGGGCVEAEVIGAALDAQAHRRGTRALAAAARAGRPAPPRPPPLTPHPTPPPAGDPGPPGAGTAPTCVRPLAADQQHWRLLHLAPTADSPGAAHSRAPAPR